METPTEKKRKREADACKEPSEASADEHFERVLAAVEEALPPKETAFQPSPAEPEPELLQLSHEVKRSRDVVSAGAMTNS